MIGFMKQDFGLADDMFIHNLCKYGYMVVYSFIHSFISKMHMDILDRYTKWTEKNKQKDKQNTETTET